MGGILGLVALGCDVLRPFFEVRMRLRAVIVGLALVGVAGCQVAGPMSLKMGRPNYNQVIHDTSKEQLFLNIVRVGNDDTMFHMDVTEVDATVQAGASASGGVSGINQAVPTGSASGSLSYAETPTVRYFPLLGQALMAQVATPISVDSLAGLFDSEWPIGTVLNLAASRLGPRYQDYYSALNAIMELDGYGALIVASGRTAPAGANDTLLLYFVPEHVDPYPKQTQEDAGKQARMLWLRLVKIFGEETDGSVRIALRTTPGALAPGLRTRSALGILRAGVWEGSFFKFVTRAEYDKIRAMQWNGKYNGKGDIRCFYTLPASGSSEADEALNAFICGADALNTVKPEAEVENEGDRLLERRLGHSRKYLLIVHGKELPPAEAFVTAFYHGEWYYVDGADSITKKNFSMVSQFTTMQAVPQPGGLLPVVSVGGK